MHTVKHRHQHISHYLILFLVILTGFFSFTGSVGQPLVQLQVGVVTAVSYAIWGIYHHHLIDDLNWKIMVEYVSLALFAIVALWLLLATVH